MRCRTLFMAFVAAVCCLFTAQRAEAGVYTDTYIYQDEGCDCVYGNAVMYIDYSYGYGTDYYPSLSASLYGPAGTVGGYDSGEGAYELSVDYLSLGEVSSYADGEYRLDAESYLYYDGPYFPYGDPMMLSYWMQFYIRALDYFDFYNGPEGTNMPVGDLGQVSSKTTVDNTPHHVKVVLDQQGYPASCPDTGIYVRQIRVQVVNQNGKAIKKPYSVAESYSNLSSNSCGNGNPVPSSCAPLDSSQRFLDSLAVTDNLCGSGISQSSGCGFTLTSTWSVCSGGLSNSIWTSTRETRSNSVKINNRSSAYSPGTQLYP